MVLIAPTFISLTSLMKKEPELAYRTGLFHSHNSAMNKSQESREASKVRFFPCLEHVFLGFPDLKVEKSFKLRKALQAVHQTESVNDDMVIELMYCEPMQVIRRYGGSWMTRGS